jgi:hypothetical protein
MINQGGKVSPRTNFVENTLLDSQCQVHLSSIHGESSKPLISFQNVSTYIIPRILIAFFSSPSNLLLDTISSIISFCMHNEID